MMRRTSLVLVCCMLAVSVAGCVTPTARPIVTPEEFGKLAAGMTLAEARAVVGVAPERVSEAMRSDGKLEERYSWSNSDGSSVEIVLLDGKLTEKASSGLE